MSRHVLHWNNCVLARIGITILIKYITDILQTEQLIFASKRMTGQTNFRFLNLRFKINVQRRNDKTQKSQLENIFEGFDFA